MFTSSNLPLPVLLSKPTAVLTPALGTWFYYENLPYKVQTPFIIQVITSHWKNKPSDQGVKSDAVKVTQNLCSSLPHLKCHTHTEPVERAGTVFQCTYLFGEQGKAH